MRGELGEGVRERGGGGRKEESDVKRGKVSEKEPQMFC